MYRGTGCDNDHERARIWLRQRDIIAGVIVFMGAMLFVAGAFHIAQSERQFALNQWEKRLRVNISDPAVKVSDWLILLSQKAAADREGDSDRQGRFILAGGH